MGESGDFMFMGEYHHNLDEKGRVVIPSKFRGLLGTDFIITKGIEKCLYVYSAEAWQEIVNKLKTLPFTKKDTRAIMRSFFASATLGVTDKQGRVMLSSPLISYANLSLACVVIGVNDHVEIWNLEDYTKMMNETEEHLEDIAENMLEIGGSYETLHSFEE